MQTHEIDEFFGGTDDESVLIAFEHSFNMRAPLCHMFADTDRMPRNASRGCRTVGSNERTRHTDTQTHKQYISIQSNADNLIQCSVNNVIN